jgi:hypothetical protein
MGHAALIALLAGCSSLEIERLPADLGSSGASSDACAAIEGMTIVRAVPLRSNGIEVTVRVASTQAEKTVPPNCLRISGANGVLEGTLVRHAETRIERTLVLALPGADEVDNARVRETVAAFVKSRPEGEQIAIYRWASALGQVVDFTARRERIHERLQASLTPFGGELLRATEAEEQAAETLRKVGGASTDHLEALVVIAPTRDPSPLGAERLRPFASAWLIGGRITEHDAGSGSFVPSSGDETEPASLAGRLSDLLFQREKRGVYRLFACTATATPAALALRVEAITTTGRTSAVAPLVLDERPTSLTTGACDATVLGAEPDGGTRRVDLSFDETQRSVYDALVSERDTADFELGVRMSPSHAVTPARAKLHGKGSLRCERKSYALDLPDKLALLPGARSDEFYLISLCNDDRYVRQHTANRLALALGLWWTRFALVEVRVDDTAAGVYELVDDVSDQVRRDQARVRAVLRRGTHYASGRPDEIKWALGDESSAGDAFVQVTRDARARSGEELVSHLRSRMDLEQYLDFVAFNTALANGDYVDELWVASTETLDESGIPGDYYTFMGWDFDGIFSKCHQAGAHAIVDPNGLVYCAEGELDHVLFADPVVYSLYVSRLERLLARITDDVFTDAAQTTRDELWSYLSGDAVRGAMVELLTEYPEASDPDVLSGLLEAATLELAERFRARRTELLSAIARYREQRP